MVVETWNALHRYSPLSFRDTFFTNKPSASFVNLLLGTENGIYGWNNTSIDTKIFFWIIISRHLVNHVFGNVFQNGSFFWEIFAFSNHTFFFDFVEDNGICKLWLQAYKGLGTFSTLRKVAVKFFFLFFDEIICNNCWKSKTRKLYYCVSWVVGVRKTFC